MTHIIKGKPPTTPQHVWELVYDPIDGTPVLTIDENVIVYTDGDKLLYITGAHTNLQVELEIH